MTLVTTVRDQGHVTVRALEEIKQLEDIVSIHNSFQRQAIFSHSCRHIASICKQMRSLILLLKKSIILIHGNNILIT